MRKRWYLNEIIIFISISGSDMILKRAFIRTNIFVEFNLVILPFDLYCVKLSTPFRNYFSFYLFCALYLKFEVFAGRIREPQMRLEIRKQIYRAGVEGQRYISLTWPIKPFSWWRSEVITQSHHVTLYGGHNSKKCNCKACPKCAESCLPENEVECDDLLQASVNFFRSARLVNAAKLDRCISPVYAALLSLPGFTRRIIITVDDGEIYRGGYSAWSMTFLRPWKAPRSALVAAHAYTGITIHSRTYREFHNFFDNGRQRFETLVKPIDRLRLYNFGELRISLQITESFAERKRERAALFNIWGFASLKLIELVLHALEIRRSIH